MYIRRPATSRRRTEPPQRDSSPMTQNRYVSQSTYTSFKGQHDNLTLSQPVIQTFIAMSNVRVFNFFHTHTPVTPRGTTTRHEPAHCKTACRRFQSSRSHQAFAASTHTRVAGSSIKSTMVIRKFIYIHREMANTRQHVFKPTRFPRAQMCTIARTFCTDH